VLIVRPTLPVLNMTVERLDANNRATSTIVIGASPKLADFDIFSAQHASIRSKMWYELISCRLTLPINCRHTTLLNGYKVTFIQQNLALT